MKLDELRKSLADYLVKKTRVFLILTRLVSSVLNLLFENFDGNVLSSLFVDSFLYDGERATTQLIFELVVVSDFLTFVVGRH